MFVHFRELWLALLLQSPYKEVRENRDELNGKRT